MIYFDIQTIYFLTIEQQFIQNPSHQPQYSNIHQPLQTLYLQAFLNTVQLIIPNTKTYQTFVLHHEKPLPAKGI